MIHALYRPCPPLRELVEFFWVSERYTAARTARERVLPSGAQVVVFHLADHPVRIWASEEGPEATFVHEAAVCGVRQRPLLLDTVLGPTVGVHFKPGGARPFFDGPAAELADRVVSLDTLWGPEARLLRERLAEETSPVARVRALEEDLLRRAARRRQPGHALRASLRALEEPSLASIAEVRSRTGLSPKRLSALFRDEVGLGPKVFWRVRRFRAALHDLDEGILRGADLAYAHGYCDQAHFLREFRSLAGSSPSEYLAARVAGTDHVSIRGKKDPIRGAGRALPWASGDP